MKQLLLAAFALAVLPWVLGCDNPAAKPSYATPSAEPSDAFVVEAVEPSVDPKPPPPPHPKPKPPVQLKPVTPKPKGYFVPSAGHPYHGGIKGPWAKHWIGHHHHGRHYLYGLYLPTWQGYTYRVWNGRWLYWSPLDYCWYRYDPVLGAFIPLNPDGTDALDTAPPPPVPPPPPPPDRSGGP